MKKYLTILCICLTIPCLGQSEAFPAVQAGFSEANITPDKPIIMSGYGGRDDPFEGVHDSVFAQAMYLVSGDEEVLVLTCDLIGHSHENVEQLKTNIVKETGIQTDQIFITAAHNHGGPVNGTYASMENLAPDVLDYIDVLYDKLLRISIEARGDVQPVRIGFERGVCKMNVNRRAVFSEGEIWLGRNPDGACDHDLDVIKFSAADGALRAVHVNYPCHGTCSGQENFMITGDWPGISGQMMKEKLGDNVVIMVTAGASANINPIYGPNDNFREINAVAYGVSSVALELVEKCVCTELSGLKTAALSSSFPGKKRWDSNLPRESESGDEVTINFSAFRMGHIFMAGISGELFTEIGMNVKNRSPGATSIMTHCNGASGYIITDAAYAEGGYEAQVSPLMPGSESDFENILVELIQSLE